MSMLQLRRMEREFHKVGEICQRIKEDLHRISITRNAVQEVANIKGTELLSPLAEGMYIKTQCISDTVHVNIGAGVIAEKSVVQATDLLDVHAKRLHDQLAKQEQMQQDISATILKTIEKENVREA